MQWNELKSEDQVDQIQEESKMMSVLIFKYSNRCSVSRVALERLERNWKQAEMSNVKPYFLDLISHRSTSVKIASQFSVTHQSPQVLIIENGRSVYNRSHFDIEYRQILVATKS